MNTSEKRYIRNMSLEDLVSYAAGLGEKPFRAEQIFRWLYEKGSVEFSKMRNLPAPLREQLEKDFILKDLALHLRQQSVDGTVKFLFALEDDEKVESVLIPAYERRTMCISTQAGCKFGCRFCASGIGGWTRNLSCEEILGQILYIKHRHGAVDLSNIVFMGIGEPLDNYDNLLKAIRIINAPTGLNLGARRITISTCGVVPKILQLAKEGLQLELAVSLHGPNNEIRNQIMPVNKKYPIEELIPACRQYIKATGRQITFEYILIQHLTCTERAVQDLAKLLKGLICKINLIPYNKVAEFPHEPPTKLEMLFFKKKLEDAGIHATIRTPRGRDVQAACGQLRHEEHLAQKA